MGVHGRAQFARGFLVLGLASLLPQRDQHLEKTCVGDLAVSVKLEGVQCGERPPMSQGSRLHHAQSITTMMLRLWLGLGLGLGLDLQELVDDSMSVIIHANIKASLARSTKEGR